MNRTTILLPLSLKVRAQRLAAEKGISLSELIRECLEAQASPKTKKKDLFFADQEFFSGEAPKDASQNIDQYLY